MRAKGCEGQMGTQWSRDAFETWFIIEWSCRSFQRNLRIAGFGESPRGRGGMARTILVEVTAQARSGK